MEDLYRRETVLAAARKSLENECENCSKIVEKFTRDLRLNNYSTGRILKYVTWLKAAHKLSGVCFDKSERKDIEELIIKIDENPNWAAWTKSDIKKIIKFFYRWLETYELSGDYPIKVKWIKARIKISSSKTPEQILTKDEVERLANTVISARDKALILVLYESGCRIGELLNIKLKDLQYDQYGCVILVSGKTGPRRIRIMDYSKYLLKWLEQHPFKDNKESLLWTNREHQSADSSISPCAVNKMLKDATKKAGITKRVHAHAFRHARATHLAKVFPEAVMKQMFGWTNDSDMAAVYYHLSGKDVDEALLKLHGIRTENIEEIKAETRLCRRCNTVNSSFAQFCKSCAFPLDSTEVIKIDNKIRKFDEFLRDFFVYYANKDKKFKEIFLEFIHGSNSENIFSLDK